MARERGGGPIARGARRFFSQIKKMAFAAAAEAAEAADDATIAQVIVLPLPSPRVQNRQCTVAHGSTWIRGINIFRTLI